MKQDSKNPGGRPRGFDRDVVLDAAVRVFWENGYEGTSLDVLTAAMGINRPSIYATFGKKHDLFLAAIDRYAAVQGMAQSAPLREEPNMKDAVAGYYRQIVKTVSSGDRPRGCLIGSVATEVAERDPVVREKIAGNLSRSEQILDRRLAKSGYDNGRPSGAMILSAGLSLAQRARLGASSSELSAIADGFIDLFFPSP